MSINYNFSQTLTKSELDHLLAAGWYRSSDFMVRANLLCLDEKICSIVNIRLPLLNFSMKKNHKRIKDKVERNFRVTIGKIDVNEEKQRLYHSFKNRLHSFVYYHLNEYFYGFYGRTIFDTREICVYDGDKLIAVSFFDLGEDSIASILGLYDLNYMKYGLGIYTMIKEIEYGNSNRYEYYYPGFILQNNNCYDYKLQFGNVQYLNDKLQWGDKADLYTKKMVHEAIYESVAAIERELSKWDIPFINKINPFYSYGYIYHFPDQFIKSISPILVQGVKGSEKLLIEYDYDVDYYFLSECVPTYDYNTLVISQDNSYYEDNENYLMDFYIYKNRIAKSKSIEELITDYLIPMRKR